MDKPARLLVIDDNSDTHEMVELLFGTSSVIHANNGKEGLERVASYPDLDAVILDLGMPVMDGFGVLERLKADRRFPFLPVCVFTANKDDATKALSLGARDFIDKRADYQELKLRVLNLVDAKRRSEAANRAKTDFLAVVSHELRTPMNGILGMVQAIRDGALSSDQSRYLEILERSSLKMMGLVEDVLQFLDSENPLFGLPRVAFHLPQVLSSVVERLSDEAFLNNVVVESFLGHGVLNDLIGLPDKLTLVLHHLVGNSIKFSPGGKVVVAVERKSASPPLVELEFSVRDTGVGFPEGWKERIFHPFTQLDGTETRKFGGLGIGLSIADRMIQMLGGSLSVESEPGRGSLFRFTLAFQMGS